MVHAFIFFAGLLLSHGLFAQKVVWFPFDEASGATGATESISGQLVPIKNHFNSPERIAGVEGNALRLDGWSTWIEEEDFTIPGISTGLSIECWYATEAFTAANSAIISKEDGSAGFTLEVELYGKLVFIFFADNTRYVLVTDDAIDRYEWNHIVATVDLVNKSARIYVNGTLWKEQTLGTHAAVKLSTNKLYVGRDTDLQEFAGFPLTTANGAIDELSVYQGVLSNADVLANFQLHEGKVPDLSIDPEVRYEGDNLRPQYHAMPNATWANEPYGLTYYNGKYHLFFQKNPNGPYLYFMHWGHLTSTDLVQWKEEKIALSPSPGFDSFGVWSGTTIKDAAGKPVVVYTGVNGAKAGIGVAFSPDDALVNWEESTSNPVIAEAPTDIKNLDFRDPFLWKEGGTYYMIVGSGLQFGGGGYLFTYKSTNLTTWTRIATLYNDTNTARSGVFWEMPFFFKLNATDWVLGVTPVPSGGVRAKAIYWIGKWHNEKFVPYDVNPKSLELISDNLLAPAVGEDEHGKPTSIGIIPEDRSVESQVAAGWRQTFSLPRTFRLLKDSTVGHIPHPNLCRLRDVHTVVGDRVITAGSKFNLPEINGNQTELLFRVKADSLARFSIHVLKNADESEFTALDFDLASNMISVDRRNSSLSVTLKDLRQAKYVFDHHDTIQVHVFLDHSTLEVFVDNVVVFSCRVYPSRSASNKVDLVVTNKQVKLVTLDSWTLRSMRTPMGIQVCEPDENDLPDALRKEKKGEVVTGNEEMIFKNLCDLYPNPARESFRVVLTSKSPQATLELHSVSGYSILKQELGLQENDISVRDIAEGIYFAKIKIGSQVGVYKLIISR